MTDVDPLNFPVIPPVCIITQAREFCDEHGIDFTKYWNEYASVHYVHKGPDYLLMMRPISIPKPAWFIFLAIGKDCLNVWLNLRPYYLPNIAYFRPNKKDKRIRFMTMEQFERRI